MKPAIIFGTLGLAAAVLAGVDTAARQKPVTAQKPVATHDPVAKAAIAMAVYKTPTCGCCAKWVDHVKASGFNPTVTDLPELSGIKSKTGVPGNLQSCHTATVGGYVIEGHVPADLIHKLLKERPKVTGIAVPGMPQGSPGMEQGGMKDPYDVLTFDPFGGTKVYDRR